VFGGEDGSLQLGDPDGIRHLLVDGRRGETSTSSTHVAHLALDGNHQRACASYSDHGIRIWDLIAGRCSSRMVHTPLRKQLGREDHRPGPLVGAFDLHGNPSHVATGGFDGSWYLWDTRMQAKQPVVHCFDAHVKPLSSLAICGTRLLSCNCSGHAVLWDLRYLLESKSASPVPTLWSVDLGCQRQESEYPFATGSDEIPWLTQTGLEEEVFRRLPSCELE